MFIFAFGFIKGLQADDELGKGAKIVGQASRQIRGEIGSINNDYISIVYKRDNRKGVEYEMLLPIDKNVQLRNRQGLKDLKEGDTVVIQYEESTVEYDDADQGEEEGKGKTKQRLRRKAKVISFVKSAKPKPEVVREEVPEE